MATGFSIPMNRKPPTCTYKPFATQAAGSPFSTGDGIGAIWPRKSREVFYESGTDRTISKKEEFP
jgi:hypothetical protein